MTNEEFIQSISLKGEEWRLIPNWERYMVSSYGRIAALSSPYKCGKKTCRRKQQLLKPCLTNSRPHYLSVVLSDGKNVTPITV